LAKATGRDIKELAKPTEQTMYALRSLNYRSKKWFSPAEWKTLFQAIAPTYNDFNATTVGNFLQKFPVKIQPGREYSVVMYIKGAPKVLNEILLNAKKIKADEAHIQEDGTLRLWWG
jgi:hypothetical protein